MRHLPLSILPALLVLSGTAGATQQEHPPGMKHMMVAPQPAAPAQTAPAQAPTVPATLEKPATPSARPALSIDKALVKIEDLKPWSQLAEVVNLSTPADIDKMIRVVEAEPGSVPPQALLFLARGLASQNRMEEAALYYYVGQLRLSFDITRWPPRLDPEEVKRLEAEQKKSPDQRSANGELSAPKFVNPHEGVVLLASVVGAPITEWLLKDPAKAETIMTRVSLWDQSASYAYLPNYALPPPTPYEEWAKLLPNVRTSFFSRMDQFISGLKKLKAQ